MAFRDLLLGFLVAYAFLPTTRAEANWYSFWAAAPDNANPIPDPGDGTPQTNSAFEEMLKKDAEPNINVQTVQSNSMGTKGFTYFWTAFIDDDKVDQKYKDLKVVVSKIKEALLPADPTPNLPPSPPPARTRRGRYVKRDPVSQAGAPRQLKFLSLPQSANNNLDNANSYAYDDSAGAGVRIYFVDSGLNLASSAWTSRNQRKQPEFIYAGFVSANSPQDLDQQFGHGTCMADIAAGSVNGAAKEADLTAVQLDDEGTDEKQRAYFETNVEALAKVADDIADKNLGDKAVILMSIGIRAGGDEPRNDAFEDAYNGILKSLDGKGVALVAAFPNNIECPDDIWPCAWGNPKQTQFRIENMITVASGNINDGSRQVEDVGDWVTIYGTGDDRTRPNGLVCASNIGNQNSNKEQAGTSHAAANVAGMMAYFKGQGLSNDDARGKLVDLAYARQPGGPNMPWNGILAN